MAEQGGWGLRGGPIYLSLQKTSASASRLSIYLSKSRAPLKLGPYLRKKNTTQAVLGDAARWASGLLVLAPELALVGPEWALVGSWWVVAHSDQQPQTDRRSPCSST